MINRRIKSLEERLAGDLAERRMLPEIEPAPARDTTVYQQVKGSLAITQEAAPADNKISVKLLNKNGSPAGEAFDATCIFADGATAANQCFPVVQTGKTVIIQQINGTWYIINPTFIRAWICT
jgi:hypothetical protein